MIDASVVKGVSETMLLPLMGRAMEAQKERGILSDDKSLEIYNNINYNFDRFLDSDIKSSTSRTVIRTCIIDKILEGFIREHPEMTVVEIGCGLNTRFDRLDNGVLQWFDLDVEKVYPVWKAFFVEKDRHRFLPASAFEEGWMKEVSEKGSDPYFFISEASVIYFPERIVKGLFVNLSAYFPGSYYLFDSATQRFLDILKDSSDPLKYCNANMRWSLEDVSLLNDWVDGVEVIKRVNVEDGDNDFSHLYPDTFGGYDAGYYLNLIRF